MDPEPCQWLGLLPAHVLGALDGAEAQALQAHLAAGCGRCEVELRELRRDVEALAHGVAPVAPPPSTREWLLAAAESGSSPRPRIAPQLLRALAAGFAALALLGAGWWAAASARRATDLAAERDLAVADRDRLATELAAARREVAALGGERAALARQLLMLGGDRLHLARLAALPAAAGSGGPTSGAGRAAAGRAFAAPDGSRALFCASGLPALPAGRTYQLWVIAAGRPIGAGTFAVGEGGGGFLLVDGVPEPSTIEAWAVTVEPAGGVPQPTGVMVLKG